MNLFQSLYFKESKKWLIFILLLVISGHFTYAQVELITPNNGITTSDSVTTFTWDLNDQAVSYQFQLSDDSSFTITDIDSFPVIGTQLIDTLNTLANKTYYWRVRYWNGIGFSNWSDHYSFTFFTPENMPKLQAWFDPSYGVTIDSASRISSWIDRSANNNDLIQADTLLQPILITNNKIERSKVVQFNGNDQYLKTLPFTLNQPHTIIILFDNLNNLPSNTYIFDGEAVTTGRFAVSNNKFQCFAGSFFWSANLTAKTNFNLVSIRFDGTNSIIRNNKVQVGSGNPGANNMGGFTLGTHGTIGGNPARYANFEGVEVLIFDSLVSDSALINVENYLTDKYAPPVNLGANIYVPYGYCDTVLNAGDRFDSYLWNTGDTTNSITINAEGAYYVDVIDIFGFTSTDTVRVFYPEIFTNNLSDTTICSGDTLTLNSKLDTIGYDFIWSDSTTDSLINITSPSQYWVTVTDTLGCSITSDTINVTIDSLPTQTSLGPDKTVCKGSSIGLTAGGAPELIYAWSTGDTTAQIIIDSAGTYFVQVTNNNSCIGRDTIIIDTNGIAPNISFSTQNLCTNALALFTDNSTTLDGSNIIGVYWDFGDGDTSTIQNPSHQYASNIPYQVSLEITTDSGCVNTLTSTVQVHSPPIAGFFATTNPICSGQTTNFSDNSFSTDGTINSWMWDFGDTGTTDTSSLQNPSYQFPVTNIYNVQIIVTTQYGCSDTVINPITVKQSPVASFTFVDSCVNNITQFTSTSQGSIFSLSWDFGDANTSSLNNPSNTYANSGIYNVTLIATENNGCIDSAIVPITIYENPIANYTAQDFCTLSSNQLYDSSSTIDGTIITWDWNVINHSNQSSNQNPIFSFTTVDTGYYFLDLIVTTDFGCKDSIRDSINVFPLPIPDFTFNPIIGAPPLLVNFNNTSTGGNIYNWSFGDDSTSTLTSPSHVFANSNTYIINLVVTSIYGCSDSTSNSILVINPITDIAVTNVNYDFISNAKFLKISAELSNFGTLVIYSLDIEAEISEKGAVMENWTGSLNGGAQSSFQFSSSFEVNGEIPDVICVRALNPNGQNDDVPSNNEFCIIVNKFQLISISPNPTSDDVNLVYIIPSTGNVNINLYNSTGKKVTELFSGNMEKGLIRQTFNLSLYSAGIYIIGIEYQGNSFKEKIVIK